MMANTIRALELHYTMIQFLIIIIMLNGYGVSFTFCATGAISSPYCIRKLEIENSPKQFLVEK